jgi:hypothetical protein
MVWRNSTATDQTDGRTAEPQQHHARKHWPDGEQQEPAETASASVKRDAGALDYGAE